LTLLHWGPPSACRCVDAAAAASQSAVGCVGASSAVVASLRPARNPCVVRRCIAAPGCVVLCCALFGLPASAICPLPAAVRHASSWSPAPFLRWPALRPTQARHRCCVQVDECLMPVSMAWLVLLMCLQPCATSALCGEHSAAQPASFVCLAVGPLVETVYRQQQQQQLLGCAVCSQAFPGSSIVSCCCA
jgi:hypothetical protein